MQAQQKLFNKIVFTLFEKFPQLFLLKVHSLSQVRPLLPFFNITFPLFSFQGAGPACTQVVENNGIEPLTS